MLRLMGICLTLAGSFGSGLAFCREKSRHAGTLFLLAELIWRMAEEIGYSAEQFASLNPLKFGGRIQAYLRFNCNRPR